MLLAGLGAALLIVGLAAVRSEAAPDTNQTPWAEQHVQEVTPGQIYRLDGCFTVTAPGLEAVSLRVVWYAEQDGYGSALKQDDLPGNPWLVGSEQCLSLTNAADPVRLDHAPCAARSARYGVVVKWDIDAVAVSSLQFALEAEATPVPCPTPTPTPTPATTPTPTPPPPSPAPTATPSPVATLSPVSPPEPTPTPQAVEPRVFPSLVNGGFEEVRQDGTPVAPIAKLRRPCSDFRHSIEGCAPSSPGSLRRTWRGMDSVAAFGADGHAGQRGAVT